MNELSKSLKKLTKNSSNPRLIEEAFVFAEKVYNDKFRVSGENYIYHCMRVASFLKNMGLDDITVAFAILHDILNELTDADKELELKFVEKKFGKEIAHLLLSISELNRIRYALTLEINLKNKKAFNRERIEKIRKMFLAIAKDLRVVLVELVARLDGLTFLPRLSEDKRKIYALETLQIFVPVANRLGLREIKRRIEDESFSHLFPNRFIEERYAEKEQHLKKLIAHIKKIFKKEKVTILDIHFRTKSYWSTYKKLVKKDMNFEKVHDFIALRIITNNVENCYRALGVIHKYFKPISEEINDYIAKPKNNGYRSLHTTIFSKEGKITEIQIRTEEMQKEAELGICAHWAYKESIDLGKEGKVFEWVKNAPDFWKNFKINFFENEVFAFTPLGDVIVLPKGSTPIDFAYAIHSQIGNQSERATINGKIAKLNQELKNGDIVEIIINKHKKPSKDWLAFAKTSLAKSHIKKSIEETFLGFKFPNPNFIAEKFIEIAKKFRKQNEERIKIKKEKPNQIFVAGQKGILIHIAKCCNPTHKDSIMAYLSPNRSAVLHKISCENFQQILKQFPEKIVEASWQN